MNTVALITVDDFDRVVIGPQMTMEEIGQLCARHSTPDREVYARVESVNGRPLAYLVRARAAELQS